VFSEADESDPGPYPIPANAPVEAGSDRHVLALQEGSCRLYELFSASFGGGGWSAYSGAIFDLRTGALRPDGRTSADGRRPARSCPGSSVTTRCGPVRSAMPCASP
jgi:hypothetical protein